MYIPVWVMWLFATVLAAMPMSVLLMARLGRKGRPKKRRAKQVEFNPLVACEGGLVIDNWSEEDWYDLLMIISQSQMRERWGRDNAHIV